MKQYRIALAGLGTVGAMVAARLLDGALPNVKLVAVSARDAARKRDIDVSACRFETDPLNLLTDDVDILVELIGGQNGAALDLVCAALRAGKPVVTANKAMLSTHADKLSSLSNATLDDGGAVLAYEAAVAGGIPVIKTLRESMAGNDVQRLCGILNGTCNYILSQMERHGLDYDMALKAAQDKGFAEADPRLDLSGMDVAQKLSLLAALAFGVRPDVKQFSVTGIEAIDARDIANAAQFDKVIRLVAVAERCPNGDEGGVFLEVSPMLVATHEALGEVHNELNALMIEAAPLGTLFLQGPGAGGGATASAVLADIADIVCGYGRPAFAQACDLMHTSCIATAPQRSYYVRLELADQSGSMAAATRILAENGVSIEEVVQRSRNEGDSFLPVVFITHVITQAALEKALGVLQNEQAFCRQVLALPVLDAWRKEKQHAGRQN